MRAYNQRRPRYLARCLAIALAMAAAPAVAQAAAPVTVPFSFKVAIGGPVRDAGTITARPGTIVTSVGAADFNGCAIVKNKSTVAVQGAYSFEIHVNYNGGLNLLARGVAPSVRQEAYMEIDHYRPGTSSYSMANGGLDLRVAINGHVYGNAAQATVRLRNGGRDGTLSGRAAQRLYPLVGANEVQGVTMQASWHCGSIAHVTAQF